MRFTSALVAAFALTCSSVSAQLPQSSIDAWYDSLSTNPQNVYSPVAISPTGTKYVEPQSAVNQWSNPSYYTNSPGFMDSAPVIDPIQYRLPDYTFNATFADGFPRAWHVWFPRDYKYKKGRARGHDHVFETLPANRGKFSVWYALHGFTDNAFYPYYDGEQEWPGMPIWSNLTAFTYHNNYILVAPEGLLNKVNIVANQVYPEFAWNAGKCCSSQNQDDVDFLTQVRNNVTALFAPKKQFLTGYSNGAFMVERMACERRDLFDAFLANAGPVNTAGATPAEILAECDAKHALSNGPAKPILLVHGKNDQRVFYQGWGGVSAPDNFAAWAARNGCPDTPSNSVNLYSDNAGLTSNVFFNTAQASYGYPVFEYPPGLTAATFNGNPRYFYLNRLPFSPSTQSYAGPDCATVELVSHYDFHVWPKKTTSIADDWVYIGNGIWDLNEYAHAFLQRVVSKGKKPRRNYPQPANGQHQDNEPGRRKDKEQRDKIEGTQGH